jgi:8-oxo-dGTP diphosphatase
VVIEATICHIIRGRKLLLKKATRGISVGKWNAPGGKLEPGETPLQCAKREVLEETGLRVSKPLYHGSITFMMDGGKNLHTRAYVFSSRDAKGTARSSAEGDVRWYQLGRLPEAQMWEDDQYWVPLVLRGIRFDATFAYDGANRHIIEFSIVSRPAD